MRVYCLSCEGLGYIDIGDCEEGIIEPCLECEGSGFLEEGLECA